MRPFLLKWEQADYWYQYWHAMGTPRARPNMAFYATLLTKAGFQVSRLEDGERGSWLEVRATFFQVRDVIRNQTRNRS